MLGARPCNLLDIFKRLRSRPIGTLTAIDPKTGDIVATVNLEDTAPEGPAADGKGHLRQPPRWTSAMK